MKSHVYITNKPMGYVERMERGIRVMKPVYFAITTDAQALRAGFVGVGMSVQTLAISCDENAVVARCALLQMMAYTRGHVERAARFFARHGWKLGAPNLIEISSPELTAICAACVQPDNATPSGNNDEWTLYDAIAHALAGGEINA